MRLPPGQLYVLVNTENLLPGYFPIHTYFPLKLYSNGEYSESRIARA